MEEVKHGERGGGMIRAWMVGSTQRARWSGRRVTTSGQHGWPEAETTGAPGMGDVGSGEAREGLGRRSRPNGGCDGSGAARVCPCERGHGGGAGSTVGDGRRRQRGRHTARPRRAHARRDKGGGRRELGWAERREGTGPGREKAWGRPTKVLILFLFSILLSSLRKSNKIQIKS